jgi:aspartate kinase
MAHLVAVLLRRSGIASQMFDGADLIVTDSHFGNARPFLPETFARVRARLEHVRRALIVPVITGYIGATRDGIVTTLGRGGGDYSATLIGAALNATEVCLWTDVDGILTADPKIVGDARTLPEISFAEASEIAALGAEVLHPHTLAPVEQQGIPLHIRNLNRPERQGTRVVTSPQPSPALARAIISARGLSLLSVAAQSDTADWGPALSRMAGSSVDILSFTQSLSERSLTIAVRAADAAFARECLSAVRLPSQPSPLPTELSLIAPVAMIAMISAPGGEPLMPRVLAALGRAEAQVLTLARSGAHITLLLPEEQLERVVRTLHADLGLA